MNCYQACKQRDITFQLVHCHNYMNLSGCPMDTSSKLFSSPLSLQLATSNHLHGKYLYSYCLSKPGETQRAQTCCLGGEGRLFHGKKRCVHRVSSQHRWSLGEPG